jgi:hypothetical protein
MSMKDSIARQDFMRVDAEGVPRIIQQYIYMEKLGAVRVVLFDGNSILVNVDKAPETDYEFQTIDEYVKFRLRKILRQEK